MRYSDLKPEFSPDRRYRYTLPRRWGGERDTKPLVVIGLNPSTADEVQDDPTIRRCIGFAKREGRNALMMLNIFALRSTDPRALYDVGDPIGPDNVSTIAVWMGMAADHGWPVIAAWGAHGRLMGRGDEIARRYSTRLLTFGASRITRQPMHPLYMRSDAPLYRWTGEVV